MAYTNQISNYGSFKYVVTGLNPGPFHTIQAALDYVLAQGETTTILLQPGTYTEDLVLYSGINIQGSEEGQVVIIGTHTPPAAGNFTISQCTLQSATDIFNSAVAGTTAITIENCTFAITSGYILNVANWTGDLRIDNCLEISTADNILNNATAAFVEILNSTVGTAGSTGMASNGAVRIVNSRIFCALALGNATTIESSTIGAAIIFAGSNDLLINNSYIDTGAAASIVTTTTGQVTISDTTINSSVANVITGTSDVELASVTFLDGYATSGVTITTTSQFRCNQAHATESMTIDAGNFNLTNGQLNINGSTGTDGQVILAATGANPVWASLTSTGGTITFTPGANTLNMESTGGAGGLTWTPSAGTALVANHGYIVNVNSLQTFTLPATAVIGDTYALASGTIYGAGTLWKLIADATHSIQIGTANVASGTSYVQATSAGDTITLVCIYASGGSYGFLATSVIGNITVNP